MAHSQSPSIFAGFFAKHGVEGTYEAISVIQGEGASAILDLMGKGYTGLNITTPLKEEAFDAGDTSDPVAAFVRAANIVTFVDGRIEVANSDGRGGVRAIESAIGRAIGGTELLVLGVGPTGRAVAYNALHAGARVAIWNRTASRAQTLITQLHGARMWTASDLPAVAFSSLPPDAQLDDDIVETLKGTPLVIDANYGERSQLGARLGRPVIDGYSMLVAQAEIAFALWSRVANARA